MATATATAEQPLPIAQPQNHIPNPLPVPSTEHRLLSLTQSVNPNPLPIPAMATPTAMEPTNGHPFVSHPQPLDLIVRYLRPRVASNVHADFILELNPYDTTPDQLSTMHPPVMAGDGPAWYFFTTLRVKKNGCRTDRSVIAGSGWSWHQDRTAKPIKSGGTIVGSKLTLSYSRGSGKERSGWIMTELSLHPRTQRQVVLCKVYRLTKNKQNVNVNGASTSTPTSPPDPSPYLHTTTPAPPFSTSPPPLREFCHPTDSDLLVKFLRPVVSTSVVVHHHTDLYKLPPADLVKEFKPTTSSDGNEVWYFFASASVGSDARMVDGGVGCWESVHATMDVLDGNKYKLGQRKLFRFRRLDGLEHVYDGWQMVQLTCNSDEAGTAGVALCKVYHTRGGTKRIRLESPIHGCLGTKKVALPVAAGQALVL